MSCDGVTFVLRQSLLHHFGPSPNMPTLNYKTHCLSIEQYCAAWGLFIFLVVVFGVWGMS